MFSDVMAAAALLLSVVSLGWQAFTWRASGARVQVEVRGAVLAPSDSDTITALSVAAINSGRSPVQVTGVQFVEVGRKPRQALLVFRTVNGSDPLPFTVQPHSTGTWLYLASALGQLAVDHGVDRLHAVVHLGNGRTARSKSFGAPSAQQD